MPLSFKHLLSFTSTAPSFNPQKINERPGLLLHHLRHLGLRWSCTCRQWCQNYDCNFFEIYNLFFTGFFPISGCTFSFCLHHHHQVPSTSSRSAIMDLQLSNLPLSLHRTYCFNWMVSKVLILQLCFTLDLQLDRMVMEMSRQFPRTSCRRLEGVNFTEEGYSLYEGIS